MQTFLPDPSFARSATLLDDRRLGKQRVEALQVVRALHLDGYGWQHHPVVAMWRGFTPALVSYGVTVVDEWLQRGYGDTTRDLIEEFVHPQVARPQERLSPDELPPWLGDDRLHASHRSALLRKDPGFYGPLLPADTDPERPYWWPGTTVPPAVEGAFAAWVVRGRPGRDRVTVASAPHDRELLRHEAARGRTTKRRRQVARLAHEMAIGDLVLVPDGDDLRVGEVVGEHRLTRSGHVRPVRWLSTLPRSSLRAPAALQDPQDVFALRDEPAIAATRGR